EASEAPEKGRALSEEIRDLARTDERPDPKASAEPAGARISGAWAPRRGCRGSRDDICRSPDSDRPAHSGDPVAQLATGSRMLTAFIVFLRAIGLILLRTPSPGP